MKAAALGRGPLLTMAVDENGSEAVVVHIAKDLTMQEVDAELLQALGMSQEDEYPAAYRGWGAVRGPATITNGRIRYGDERHNG